MSTRRATSKASSASDRSAVQHHGADHVETSFAEVVGLIEQARQRAYQAVDSELVGLYWRIGQYISAKLAAAVWGEGVVDRLAQHLARTLPGQPGAQPDHPDPVQAPEEREFYLRMAVQEKWTSRELERQHSLGTFERAVLSPAKVSAALTQMHGAAAEGAFKDAYSVEFLNLPADHTEADLHSGLLGQIRSFLIELGRDFCFVGTEFPMRAEEGWGAMIANLKRLDLGFSEVGVLSSRSVMLPERLHLLGVGPNAGLEELRRLYALAPRIPLFRAAFRLQKLFPADLRAPPGRRLTSSAPPRGMSQVAKQH